MKYPYKILTKLYSNYEIMLNHTDFSSIQISGGKVFVCDDWDANIDKPIYNDYTNKLEEGSWFIELIFESLDSIEIYKE